MEDCHKYQKYYTWDTTQGWMLIDLHNLPTKESLPFLTLTSNIYLPGANASEILGFNSKNK